MRPSLEDTFMSLAKVWALRSTCTSRVAVGAVLVNKAGQVIASGYNGSPRGTPHCDKIGCSPDADGHCTNAIHAEENAILQCAMTGASTVGCSLYVTHSPCMRCAKQLLQVGIKRVLFSVFYGNTLDVKEYLQHYGVYMGLFRSEEDWLED
jgi:dCMP deaminase